MAEIITALDIGTTKICCIIASPDDNGGVNIVGIGNAPSRGMARGMVTNVDRTVSSIRAAVTEAERMAGCTVGKVMLGLAGGSVNCYNSKGVVGVRDQRNRIITEDDKRRAIESAVAGEVPQDREPLHTIEQEYSVDGQTGIKDPVGMMGMRLEVNMHISTVSLSALQNVLNCARQSELQVDDDDVVLESLASAESVLTPAEMGMGVAILDFGGGTTDIGVFAKGCIRHTKVLNLGGDSLTRDIFMTLRTSMDEAEQLKINDGCCLSTLLPAEDEIISVPGPDGVPVAEVSRHILCDILESRVEEIMGHVSQELIMSGFDDQVMEIVITGGSSLLRGVPELATEIFDRPVRVGYPASMGGLSQLVNSPKFSTGLGLILYGLKNHDEFARQAGGSGSGGGGLINRLFGRILGRGGAA
ncbi:MAG: cell division protein FtsA [Deltaproteobacteria bacterium]|jgi:cell division protein FtsA|nr:cell division protein FtsA [Deltaproteobacteria bacterium]